MSAARQPTHVASWLVRRLHPGWGPLGLFLLAVAVRAAWAFVTIWREDQAATLWLGANVALLSRPIGLLSSTTFPNPNGMTLVGSLLARAPGLYGSSLLLGVLQALLLAWLCREVCGRDRTGAWLAALALVCEPLVSFMAVEFWNQYTVGLFDVLFVASAVRFARSPSWRVLPLWTFLGLFVPGLYLAGLANAVAYAIIGAGLVVVHRRALRAGRLLPHALLAVAVAGVVVGLVWLPFLDSVDLAGLARLSTRPRAAGARLALEAIWMTPVRAVPLLRGALLSMPVCAGDFPWRGLVWLKVAWPAAAAAVPACGVAGLLWQAGARLRRRTSRREAVDAAAPALSGVLLCVAFVWLSVVLSPLLGGPALAAGERPDHLAHLVPFVIVAGVAAVRRVRARGWVPGALRLAGFGAFGLYLGAAALAGTVLVTRHLAYAGTELTGSDVPLRNKQRVVCFVAEDWRAQGRPGGPSVYYHLMADMWTFIPNWNAMMARWYPQHVFTVGRGFDYELWRVHGLRNAQEGRVRTPQGARYIVTYAREPAPGGAGLRARHTVIGRLRVSVVEWPSGPPR